MSNTDNDNVIPEKETNNNDNVFDSIPEDAQDVNTYSAPYETTTEAAPSSIMAIVSFGLSIFSVVCCCNITTSLPAAVISLILGILSIKNNCGGRNFAVAGIIISLIGLIICIILIAAIGLYAAFGFVTPGGNYFHSAVF